MGNNTSWTVGPPADGGDDTEERKFDESFLIFSNLGRNVEGTGMTYRAMKLMPNSRVGPLKGIEVYTHIQHLDLSGAMIKDVAPLKALRNTLTMNLSHNEMKDLKGWEPVNEDDLVFPNLVSIELGYNKFEGVPSLVHLKELRRASFKGNEITTCVDLTGGSDSSAELKLEHLDMTECTLQVLTGLKNMPNLTTLDLSRNKLANIDGLGELTGLKELIITGNSELNVLGGPWQESAGRRITNDQFLKGLPQLHTLDCTNCGLDMFKAFEVLRALPNLRHIKVTPNPVMNEDDAVAKILSCHWRLTHFDGREITSEEHEKARENNRTRIAAEREIQTEMLKKVLEQQAAEGGASPD